MNVNHQELVFLWTFRTYQIAVLILMLEAIITVNLLLIKYLIQGLSDYKPGGRGNKTRQKTKRDQLIRWG